MDPGQNLPRPPSGISLGANVSVAAAGLGSSFGGTPGGGSFSDSSEFVGPVPVMDEVARIRMAIGDDEVRSFNQDSEEWKAAKCVMCDV